MPDRDYDQDIEAGGNERRWNRSTARDWKAWSDKYTPKHLQRDHTTAGDRAEAVDTRPPRASPAGDLSDFDSGQNEPNEERRERRNCWDRNTAKDAARQHNGHVFSNAGGSQANVENLDAEKVFIEKLIIKKVNVVLGLTYEEFEDAKDMLKDNHSLNAEQIQVLDELERARARDKGSRQPTTLDKATDILWEVLIIAPLVLSVLCK